MSAGFDHYLRSLAESACDKWQYPYPPDAYYQKIYKRLPVGLRTLLVRGIDEKLVIRQGFQFLLKDLPSSKGPYQWFSRNDAKTTPRCNWEYFVQVGEFVRLHQIARANGFVLAFEDEWMDLALYRNPGDKHPLVGCEVKVESDQIRDLAAGIKAYEPKVDLSAPDRGNDTLRKAKYIVRKRPEYLSLVAIGSRLEYHVTYSKDHAFKLERDVIPWV